MGTRKKVAVRPATKANVPAIVHREPAAKSDNPLDWLYLLSTFPGFVFGVLRKEFRGFTDNDVISFILKKLRPVVGLDASGRPDPSLITAWRHGAVLPPEAPDSWDDPLVLAEAMAGSVLPHHTSLLVYVTIAFPEARRLHEVWEMARAFALDIARARGTPIIIVQHAPSEMGSGQHPPHVHLLIACRAASSLGGNWGAVDAELICDDGESVLHAEWQAFRERWAKR